MDERSRDSEAEPAGSGGAARDAGTEEPPPEQRSLSPLQVVGSTLASAFGVQSSRNRERDFSRGKASHFIIAGVVFTVLFVLGVVLVVNLVLSAAA